MGIAVMQAQLGRPYRPTIHAAWTSETTVELTYTAFVNEYFIAQPDIQLIRNPDADGRLTDAWSPASG